MTTGSREIRPGSRRRERFLRAACAWASPRVADGPDAIGHAVCQPSGPKSADWVRTPAPAEGHRRIPITTGKKGSAHAQGRTMDHRGDIHHRPAGGARRPRLHLLGSRGLSLPLRALASAVLLGAACLASGAQFSEIESVNGCPIRPATLCNDFNLQGARLPAANLAHAALSRTNLTGADLHGANMHHADMDGANLHAANLNGATLDHVDARRADMAQAQLHDASLVEARLQNADFSHADLSGARFRGADLSGATLIEANLSGASLERANLRGANLRGADLRNANLAGATLDRAELEGADLTGARIDGASFASAQTQGCRGCPGGEPAQE